jgi:hypothetical protein
MKKLAPIRKCPNTSSGDLARSSNEKRVDVAGPVKAKIL